MHLDAKNNLYKILIYLTSIFILAQVTFFTAGSLTHQLLDTTFSASLSHDIIRSHIFVMPLLQLIFNQIFLYSLCVFGVWYCCITIAKFFNFTTNSLRIFGVITWIVFFVGVICANALLVKHSFFSHLLKENVIALNDTQLQTVALTSAITIGVLFSLSCILACRKFFLRQATLADGLFIFLILAMFVITAYQQLVATPHPAVITRNQQPNIIFIGVDALRPDFIGFYKQRTINTPFMNAFLKSSISFSETYTTLARTFPSWMTILTAKYPIHHQARGNNTDLALIDVTDTLPKRLQAAGYETIYGTDDTRFNNTNQSIGFDHIVTPPMGLNDFFIATINDFPLSNLIIPTPLGKILFPYNYANHGAAITYSPNNFLQLLKEDLHNREAKPLFLAVHFTLSHWPFFWFNDHLADNQRELSRYSAGITATDKQLTDFFAILKNNHLLENTIVVLLSDHGTSIGLPDDRIVRKELYQGNPINIKKLGIARYNSAPLNSTNFEKDFGIDTSYGYGGDILSLKQYHTVLAFKGFGIDIGNPHNLNDKVSMMDIAPSILALLNLPALPATDGRSLTPYFNSKVQHLPARDLFFETTFSLEEIEREGISVKNVLAKTLKLYQMDLHTGLIFVKHDAERAMNLNKQHAIQSDRWWLASYPESQHNKLVADPEHPGQLIMKSQIVAPFFVLVDLKTGKWTTELNTAFAKTAPVSALFSRLKKFYGTELPPLQ